MRYKEVIKDFNSGVLDKSKIQLIMDNDGGYWSGLTDNDDVNDKLSADAEEKYGSPDGYKDIISVLTAAGVNADWC
tara:strand:- start:871 stop:1098 length:228 start_codon:yes stop_codon:yes gene_type:complete